MSTERDKFVYRANPNEWLEVSDELNNSIEIIQRNCTSWYFKSDTWDGKPIKKLMSSRSIFLLMGFSLENLIKGILIFDNPKLVNKGKLEKDIKSHNLINLFNKIEKIKLTDKESELLNILSEAIPDWGRYPCPLNFQDLKDEVIFTTEMKKRYDNIRNTLRIELLERLENGWFSGLENPMTNVQIKEFKRNN